MSLTRGVNIFVLYKIIKALVTPFNKTKAYELGLIDDNGKILKSRKDLKTSEEKDAFTLFDLFIFNIKKLLAKIPGGKSMIATTTAAMFLLKEQENIKLINHDDIEKIKLLEEDVINEIANAVGTGQAVSLDKPFGDQSRLFRNRKKVIRKKFAGMEVFVVDSDTYTKLLNPKNKNDRYVSLVGDGRIGTAIKKYAYENPGKPILIQNSLTNHMKYLRY